jgi:2-polyprenyl-3-methyl-5-hydroxy-6-metoxy-1,4-benzoquinol methylase
MSSTSPTTPEPPLDYSIQYRLWHDDSDEHAAAQASRFNDLFGRLLPDPTDAPVLDIGCGMGFAIRALMQHGFTNTHGIETDLSQVAACRSKGLNVELAHHTPTAVRQRTNKYALILLLDVLEHIPRREHLDLLKAAHDALLPSGRIILSVPNASSLVHARWFYNDYTHRHPFTDTSLRFLLLNAGFQQIDITSSDPANSLRNALRPVALARALFCRRERRSLKLSIVRWMWKQVLDAEIPCDVSTIPLGRNLHVVAFKD